MCLYIQDLQLAWRQVAAHENGVSIGDPETDPIGDVGCLCIHQTLDCYERIVEIALCQFGQLEF